MSRVRAIVIPAILIAGTVPLTAQTLGPCPAPFDDRWECGSLPVYENRQTSQGRTINVEVRVRRARDRGSHPPIFIFSGGPGAPAASSANPNMLRAQAASHDLVLIDQRGTGRSNGFRCNLGLTTQAARAFGQLYPMKQIGECRTEVGTKSDPDQYTTGDFVEDVDAVRVWLGYPTIIVSGGSYGTRSAMTYMAEYPDRVAGAVLNAVIPPESNAPLGYAGTAQVALDQIFADCGRQPKCAMAYPDLPATFDRLMADLRASPARVEIRRPDGTLETVSMAASDLGYAVRIMMYSRRLLRSLPRWIHEAGATGDLSRFGQAHYDRARRVLSAASIGLHFSVFCAEDVPYVREDQVTAAVEGTFFGRYLVDQYMEGCRRWSIDRRDRRSHQSFTLDAPVLLLSGRYDPVTPPAFAESVRSRFPNSRHFILGDGGHGAGGGCVGTILSSFYEDLDPGRLTDACASIRTATFEVP